MVNSSNGDGVILPIVEVDTIIDIPKITNNNHHHSITNEILLYGGIWQKKNFSFRCSVNRGDTPILSKLLPPSVPTYSCIPPNIIFMGECYMCGIKGHSQNYCPKKYCELCKKYGHGDKVCPKSNNSFTCYGNNNNNYNIKRKNFDYNTGEVYYQKLDGYNEDEDVGKNRFQTISHFNEKRFKNKRNEFGSGWKRQRMEIRSW